MRGIFLDETTSQYEPASAQFYETIASAVRSEAGLGSNPLVSSTLLCKFAAEIKAATTFQPRASCSKQH
jgi:hypothetical protein